MKKKRLSYGLKWVLNFQLSIVWLIFQWNHLAGWVVLVSVTAQTSTTGVYDSTVCPGLWDIDIQTLCWNKHEI